MNRPGLVRVVSASLLVFSFAWGCGETSDPDRNATSLNPDGAASLDEELRIDAAPAGACNETCFEVTSRKDVSFLAVSAESCGAAGLEIAAFRLDESGNRTKIQEHPLLYGQGTSCPGAPADALKLEGLVGRHYVVCARAGERTSLRNVQLFVKAGQSCQMLARAGNCDSCASDGGSDAGAPPDATAPDAAAPDATLADAGTDEPPMPDATSPPDAGHDASSPPDAGADAPTAAPALALLLAKTHLEGAFLTTRSIWADENRIYLASRFSPRLFVLGRNEAANFPILHVVDTSPVMPSSVGGDAGRLYVGMWGPALRVYRTEPAFELERIVDVPGATDLINLQVLDGRVYVSAHQTVHFSVNDPHVYVAALNEGDVVRSFSVDSFAEGLTYGTPAEPFRTAVFDRISGAPITVIDNPLDILSRPSQVALEADGDYLMMMNPGCCGDGIRLFRTPSMVLERFIPYMWTNAVVRRGHWLLAGTEAGTVALFDLRVHPALKTAELDLRALTGHTGIEDIEIRALLWDGRDGLAFAGSSWGNDQSRGPELPSFFVLRVSGTGS